MWRKNWSGRRSDRWHGSFVYELPVWAVSVGLVSREGCMVGFSAVLMFLFWNIAGGLPTSMSKSGCMSVNLAESTIMMPSSRMPSVDCRYGDAGLLGSAASTVSCGEWENRGGAD